MERRENLLEDQSSSDRTKLGRETATDNFNYYLGCLGDKSITHHFKSLGDVSFAKRWGMAVAVGDLHRVIAAAKRLSGQVVLGGHSLGGSVVTAYATWDFDGRPGAADLSGLVFIDGSSFRAPESAAAARTALSALAPAKTSPWLIFGGIPAPLAGVFENTGALGALKAPNDPSVGQAGPLLPAALKPSVRVTNLGEYGFAQNVGTSPSSLIAAQAHLGKGVATGSVNGVHGWDSTGALTPITRYAQMFAGADVLGADGVEWYFPQRLTDDTAAVGNGLANPAQGVLDVHSTLGRKLPHSLLMYAFGARLGGAAVLQATQALARQSGIPSSHLTLINRQSTYAHNDPAGAYPRNAFFSGLIPFLRHGGRPRAARRRLRACSRRTGRADRRRR